MPISCLAPDPWEKNNKEEKNSRQEGKSWEREELGGTGIYA